MSAAQTQPSNLLGVEQHAAAHNLTNREIAAL
jgi:hypothetical protein